ncbi:MAG: hypothetical protein R3300_12900 [Candidatus Promineifilaceae bacterium]|nr:hypothetical protein [Candidatus Promineifilaceae bacterium]
MIAKKKVFLLAGLLLALALLAGAPDAAAHPEEACHFWIPWQGAHNIEEGDDVCFYVNLLWPTKGLLNQAIRNTVIDVTIVDGDGQTIVADALGQYGPIEKADPNEWPGWVGCPMPTNAVVRWEYSPGDLGLSPGEYTVSFNVTVEKKILSSGHMCGPAPHGDVAFLTPADSGPLPWASTLIVHPAD